MVLDQREKKIIGRVETAIPERPWTQGLSRRKDRIEENFILGSTSLMNHRKVIWMNCLLSNSLFCDFSALRTSWETFRTIIPCRIPRAFDWWTLRSRASRFSIGNGTLPDFDCMIESLTQFPNWESNQVNRVWAVRICRWILQYSKQKEQPKTKKKRESVIFLSFNNPPLGSFDPVHNFLKSELLPGF